MPRLGSPNHLAVVLAVAVLVSLSVGRTAVAEPTNCVVWGYCVDTSNPGELGITRTLCRSVAKRTYSAWFLCDLDLPLGSCPSVKGPPDCPDLLFPECDEGLATFDCIGIDWQE